MKTHKNIDRLFQEKLKDFEVSPPKGAWDNIENKIHVSNKKPFLSPWLKIGSAAAILLLLTITGVNYFNSPSNFNEVDPIVNGEEELKIPTSTDPSNIDFENINKEIVPETKEVLIADIETQENNNQEIKNNTPPNSKQLEVNKQNNRDKISSIVSKSDIDNKQELINSQKNTIEKRSPTNLTTSVERSNSLNPSTNSSITTVKDDKKIEGELKVESSEKELMEEDITEIAENTNEDSLENIEDLLKEELEEEENEDESVSKKWSLATIAGPVFFNSFTADNSLIDESFITNENQISNSISTGIKVGYKLNKKLSLQTGVNIVKVNSQTNNVFVKTSLNPQYLSAINYDPLAQLMNISAEPTNDLSLARSEVVSSYTFEGVLNQEFGYIEVPLEVKYNLTSGEKIGLNLVGGVSTLFLNKNDLYYTTEAFSAKIGEANNLNDINFSGNFGIDVDYNINKQLFFNVSPMLKIQTNTFSSNSGNFKPYVIGVYTGLNYKF